MSAVKVKLAHCQACGKKAYPNERTAIRFALRYSFRRGVALRVYHCRHSNAYHLTKKELR